MINSKPSIAKIFPKNYEHKAKDCLTCETKGACCLDAHFVNVNITRLEAVAMRKVLDELDEVKQTEINYRIAETIEQFELKDSGDTFLRTFLVRFLKRELVV
ncbi:MAG: hypothetical protein HC846_03460 [Blastocatellia bacterium]|nr:hypothetical protein [Blastocatellia bacterium]